MPFATKGDLKQRVSDWFARNDSPFTSRLDDFVALAEGRIYYGAGANEGDPLWSPPVRCRAMEATSDDTGIVNGEGGLPDDFLETRALTWKGSTNSPLVYREPLSFWESDEINRAGTTTPTIYTIEGDIIRVAPAATGQVRISYYKKLTSLSGAADTNWLLLNHPAVYLHAVMLEAGVFAKEAARTQTALQQYRAAVSGLVRTNLRSTFQGPMEPVFR
jgi:hypothetical protein